MPLLSPIVLEKSGFGLILLLALVAFAIMTAVFRYHWKQFGIPTPLFRKMTRAYFLISGGLSALAVLLYGVVLMSF